MARAVKDFSPADPTETSIYSFDFSPALATGETLSTSTWVVNVGSGADTTPSARMIGSSTISGSVISQKIGTLLAGVTYEMVCTVTTSQAQTLTLYSDVYCKAIA